MACQARQAWDQRLVGSKRLVKPRLRWHYSRLDCSISSHHNKQLCTLSINFSAGLEFPRGVSQQLTDMYAGQCCRFIFLVEHSGGNWQRRMDPAVGDQYCGLPYELSNFQGFFDCDNGVKIGRPKTIAELQAMVTMFPKAKASGMGASFNKEFFCSGNDTESINIVMTELTSTLDFITRNPKPADYANTTIIADFPIQVDEDMQTVTVAAGVPQRMLLDWLADYRYWEQPAGWILPAQSWFIDQTIGGAVATNTHGSSMQHGSLSSQVVGLKVVLANGTLLEVSPKINRHLWRAMGVSVGRLGIITEVTMRIKPQMAVEKKATKPSYDEWVAQIRQTQEDYKGAKAAGDVAGMKRALSQVDEMQTFWHVPLQNMWRADFEYLNKEPLAVNLNIDTSAPQDPLVKAMSGPGDDVFTQLHKAAVPVRPTLANNARYWANYYATMGQQYVVPGTYEASKAYLSMTEQGVRLTAGWAGYDQYEVSIPMEIAADCMAEVGAEIYGPKALWNGFRTPGLIRFVPGEEFYLSNTNGGPRMYINLEDYVSHQTGRTNKEFLEVIKIFRERCNARLHWGKAGWVQLGEKPFDGAAEYPETWCHFGCAVSSLDPHTKFASQSNAWWWGATRDGKSVPFDSCCTPSGFSAQCKCAKRPAA